MLESIIPIEGNVDVFSPFCDLKIGIVEDVGKCAVEVRLVQALVGSPCTGDHASRSISTNNVISLTSEP